MTNMSDFTNRGLDWKPPKGNFDWMNRLASEGSVGFFASNLNADKGEAYHHHCPFFLSLQQTTHLEKYFP